MIRVAPNRCGYTGYECVGLPDFPPLLTVTQPNCDELRNRTALSAAGVFDNYYNIPTRFSGFTQSIDHILDMNATLPINELDCIQLSAADDAPSGAFLDLYNLPAYNAIVDAAVCAAESAYAPVKTALLCCNEDGKEFTVCPGLMEPLLDVTFDPVGIEVMPLIDVVMDGAMIAVVNLTKWRYLIEEYLNQFGDILSFEIDALFELIVALNEAVHSPTFSLEKTGGLSLDCSDDGSNRPTYDVTGGTILVNKEYVTVDGLQGLVPPFTVYLNIYFENRDAETGNYSGISATLSLQAGGDISQYLGAVTDIDAAGCTFWDIDWDNISGVDMGGGVNIPNFNDLMPPGDGLWEWASNPRGGGHWRKMKTSKC